MEKKNTRPRLEMLLLIIAFLAKGIVDSILIKDDPNGPMNVIKYILLVMFIVVSLYNVRNYNHRDFVFKRELKIISILALFMVIISSFYQIYYNNITSRTIKEFMFFYLPVLAAFCIMNILNLKQIKSVIKIIFFITAISYLVQVGSAALSFQSIVSAFKQISFSGGNNSASISVLESSAFADVMMACFCFFGYYNKGDRKWEIISFLFVFLANKRLMVLFSAIILVASFLPASRFIFNRYISRISLLICIVVFSIMPFIVIWLTSNGTEWDLYNKFGINLPDFWMGRDVMVRNIIASGFKSYGLGSTFVAQGSLLEVESVKFLLELNFIGVAIISSSYWILTRRKVYTVIIMLYLFLNMNTSTSIMTGTFAWIIYLTIIGATQLYSSSDTREGV